MLLMHFFSSREYRENLPSLVRNIFVDAKRIWHVHATKTGGTTFYRSLHDAGWAVINSNILENDGISASEISKWIDLGRLKAGWVVTGHKPLWHYEYIKGNDRAYAFVRDPIERVISNYRYMCQRVIDDNSGQSADVKFFLDQGLDVSSFDKTFHSSALFTSNEQCTYLSRDRTCLGALEAAEVLKCEICSYERVSDVLDSIIAVKHSNNYNISTLKKPNLAYDIRKAIILRNVEDYALLRIISERPT